MSHAAPLACEDYNKLSPERVALLQTLRARLDHRPVQPIFWACCVLADLGRLKSLCSYDRQGLDAIQHNTFQLFLPWNIWTRAREGTHHFGTLTGPQESAHSCKKRDGYRCILTRNSFPDAAHILPPNLMTGFNQPISLQNAPFWASLNLYWTDEQIALWQKSAVTNLAHFNAFTNLAQPAAPINFCGQMIALDPLAHVLWYRGLFALKPIRISHDQRELEVQFFWQHRYRHRGRNIDITTTPRSSEGLQTWGGPEDHLYHQGNPPRKIRSGDRFTFRTDNPVERPLPNWDLLQMQWVLHRVVCLGGVADLFDY